MGREEEEVVAVGWWVRVWEVEKHLGFRGERALGERRKRGWR